MTKKRLLLILLATLLVIYLIGPHPADGEYTDGLNKVPYEGMALEHWISAKESREKIKPDNQARIIWQNDSLKQKTKYAIVYLHGFTASQEEGNPTHLDFAKYIGANMYLSRLSEHGLQSPEPLLNMTATSLWESAKEAYAIGKKLGDSVILMGTSTGGTLALMLAAEQYPEIAGMVLLSPNIRINDNAAFILNNHWGVQLARLIKSGNTIQAKDTTSIYRKYWYTPYRIEGAAQLQQMLEDKMNKETFKEVKQPALLMYYYKDDVHQDSVVKVSAMLDMFENISTPVNKKHAVAIPNAGDHVIGSYIKSRDVPTVEQEVLMFAELMNWKQ